MADNCSTFASSQKSASIILKVGRINFLRLHTGLQECDYLFPKSKIVGIQVILIAQSSLKLCGHYLHFEYHYTQLLLIT